MLEEEILLLIKENKHKEAIKRYVDIGKYAKAEEFCVNRDKSLGLLTTLLTIYFEQYEDNKERYERLIEEKQITKGLEFKDKANRFREMALNVMRNHSSKN